jgi:hypothetical protein
MMVTLRDLLESAARPLHFGDQVQILVALGNIPAADMMKTIDRIAESATQDIAKANRILDIW